MTQVHPDSPQARFDAAKAAADAIFAKAKAGNRNLTPTEISEVTKHLDEADALKSHLDAAARAERLTGGLFGSNAPEVMGGGTGGSFKAQAASQLVTKAEQAFNERFGARGFGLKALIGGVVGVGSILPDVATIPGRPTSILQLINIERQEQPDDVGNKFNYQQQTARTNNAATVADGQTKPTSIFTFTEGEGSFKTVAHLSEKYPERFLADYRTFIEILKSQMAEGLIEEVERLVLAGNAAAASPKDEWNGILNTAGVQTQAAITGDLLGTLSAARYKLLTAYQTPTGWAMNPADVAKLELMRESGTSGPLMFRSGRSQIEEVLGAHPIVVSPLVAAGTAIVADWSEARLIPRDQAELKADSSGTNFESNQVQFRLEERFGFYVHRPLAFVKVTLPA